MEVWKFTFTEEMKMSSIVEKRRKKITDGVGKFRPSKAAVDKVLGPIVATDTYPSNGMAGVYTGKNGVPSAADVELTKALVGITPAVKPIKADKSSKSKSQSINIPQLKLERFTVKIIGTSSLICEAWSQKVVRQMLAKHMGEATEGREAKKPMQDFANSLHWLTPRPDIDNMDDAAISKAIAKGKFGFPACGIKAACITACSTLPGVFKTVARQAFFFHGTDKRDMVTIVGTPVIRQDMVRNSNGQPDIRFRAEFVEWEASIQVTHNPTVFSRAQIVNLLQQAGFGVGIGGWRPGKSDTGQMGTFMIENG